MEDLSFEKRIDKSKQILEKLMNPEITLSDSVKYYKEGITELEMANKLLEEAKLKFETYQNSDDRGSVNL
ncbi:MAG: exodeoxyribonuclease VII small subunit [Epsilonproteobacteria bacterium]|nr:exodeoxyribonuclease VII small subunit [Campylobacterota bacterium]